MCGLFGFDGHRPAIPSRLAFVAELAGRRGPHAVGVAWDAGGTLDCATVTQPTAARVDRLLERCSGSARVIGHFRLATSGGWRDVANNQPLVVDGIAVAHNGNIPNWQALATSTRVRMRSQCDSELLALWMHRAHGRLGPRLTAALRYVHAPYAVLALRAGEAVGANDGLPLYRWVQAEGTYFCSLDPALGPWLSVPAAR